MSRTNNNHTKSPSYIMRKHKSQTTLNRKTWEHDDFCSYIYTIKSEALLLSTFHVTASLVKALVLYSIIVNLPLPYSVIHSLCVCDLLKKKKRRDALFFVPVNKSSFPSVQI